MTLSYEDVHNIRVTINKKKQGWSSDDATSVKMWVEQNPDHILVYREANEATGDKFLLAWASPWQMQTFATDAHENAVAMDATFGDNEYEYSLYTLLTYDGHQNGLPCIWAITERHTTLDLGLVLAAAKEKAKSYA
ncbi:unnamed protein product [Calypogeia fissa]